MQRKGAFDYILLETTGLADPGASPPSALMFVRRRTPRSNSIHLLAKRGFQSRKRERYRIGRCSLRCGCIVWEAGAHSLGLGGLH